MAISSIQVVNGSLKSTIKFLCSYGGRILPRYPDGKLRYHGGHTRVLAVDRSISFSELLVKLGEMCGTSVSLRCQLPADDLDALVSVTSDEDLSNLIEEYDHAASVSSSSSLKIRAFLSPPKPTKKMSTSPPPSYAGVATASMFPPPLPPCSRISPPLPPSLVVPLSRHQKSAGKVPHYAYHAHGNSTQIYHFHHRKNWQ